MSVMIRGTIRGLSLSRSSVGIFIRRVCRCARLGVNLKAFFGEVDKKD